MKLRTETVTPQLHSVAKTLSAIPELSSFRLVGGTAIALQLGHRKSVDIDFFSTNKIAKRDIEDLLRTNFDEKLEIEKTQHSLLTTIRGVRVEFYDDWSTPFLEPPLTEEGIRLATLKDLANFKLEAIIERREKKDYIDLYFLFKKLDPESILRQHRKSNPLVSERSILFALNEVKTASINDSPMPDLLQEVSWKEIIENIRTAAKDYFNKDMSAGL